MCTPRFRWTPEHSIQTRTPSFSEAQSGSGAPQSAHLSFPQTLRNTWIGFSLFSPVLLQLQTPWGALKMYRSKTSLCCICRVIKIWAFKRTTLTGRPMIITSHWTCRQTLIKLESNNQIGGEILLSLNKSSWQLSLQESENSTMRQ